MKNWDGKTKHRYAHVKRDGFNIRMHRKESGLIVCKSRNHNELDLKFLPVMRTLYERMPRGWEVGCELWKPGEPASYISSGIAQQDSEMHLDVFQVYCGMPYRSTLQYVEAEVARFGLSFIPYFARTSGGNTEWNGDISQLPTGDPDIEGYVLKNMNGGTHYKFKPFRELTLRCTGWVAGKGKYTGKIGALLVSDATGREVASCSGMTDEEREVPPDSYLGALMDIKFQSVGAGGRLRHPTFVKLRTDKDAPDVVAR